jgi:F-type H+-transporting ATPase subunit gamma
MVQIAKYRKKIRSAKNIAKITKAMEMVAASKMKRAQDNAKSSREYANGIIDLSLLLTTQIENSKHILLNVPKVGEKELLVLFAPEKGLCGSMFNNLAKFTLSKIKDLKNPEFILVGKKAKKIISSIGGTVLAEFELGLSQPKYDLVPPIANVITERFLSGEISKISAIYADFVNTMTQLPTVKTLLPLQILRSEYEETENQIDNYYLFEPSSEDIIESILKIYLEVEIYQVVLEAFASEQSARMIAMKNASDNATSLINGLTIDYNKIRQSTITSEILDIGNAS